MQKHRNESHKLSTWVIAIFCIINGNTSVDAREIKVDGAPCNELCQAWMGYKKHIDADSIIDRAKIDAIPRDNDGHVVASEKNLRPRGSTTKTAADENVHPIDKNPPVKTVKPGSAAKHVMHKTHQARSSTPLAAPRSAIPGDPHSLIADDPALAAPRSPEPSQKTTEPASTSFSDTGPIGSIARIAPPLPVRAAATGASNSEGKPVQAILPAITATPTSPAVSPLPQPPRVAMVAPIGQTSKPPVDTSVPATPQVAGGAASQISLDPTSAAPSPPSTTVAALPSLVDAGSRLQNDDYPGGIAREGSLHPTQSPSSNSLSVRIGQITAEPRGTDVHLVVSNVIEHEVKDIDVRCKVRDAQGVEIAKSAVHIASIAPSDIVFERVLFQPAITTQDNRFVCEVARIAATADMKP